jgi:hypothetical protein
LEWRRSASGFNSIRQQTSERACLPAGPLERLKRRGAGGRVFEKRSVQDLQEGVELFLGRRSVTWKPLLVICVDARE